MYSAVVKENAVLSRSAVVNSTVPRLEAGCRGKAAGRTAGSDQDKKRYSQLGMVNFEGRKILVKLT